MACASDISESYKKSYISDHNAKIVENTLSLLKFISKIKKNEVVDTSSLTMMELGVKTSLYRTFVTRSESRDATLKLFSETINTAFELAEKHLSSESHYHNKIGIELITSIQKSVIGIEHHKLTYSACTMHVSEVETFLSLTGIRLSEIYGKYFAIMEHGRLTT